MATFKNLESLFSAIDDMDIYQKDYNMITSLLENVEPKLFTKILEEILDGNLYWSDFEPVFSSEYGDTVRKILKEQKEINQYVERFIKFRRFMNSDYEYNYEEGTLFIRNNTGNSDVDKLFTEEYRLIRDDILNSLTKENKNDNAITIAMKAKLYNALKNGEILIKIAKPLILNSDYIDGNIEYKINTTGLTCFSYEEPISGEEDITHFYYDQENKKYEPVTDQSYNGQTFIKHLKGRYEITDIQIDHYGYERATSYDKEKRYYIWNNSSNEYELVSTALTAANINSGTYYTEEYIQSYDYINPEDIFLFLNSYTIPLNDNNLILTEFDKAYMTMNHLDETTVRHFKSLGLLMRKKNFFLKKNEE